MFESPLIFQRPMIEMVDGTGHFSEIISGKRANTHCFLDRLAAVFGKPILVDLFHDKKVVRLFRPIRPKVNLYPIDKKGKSRFKVFALYSDDIYVS